MELGSCFETPDTKILDFSYSQDSPAVSETDLRTAFSSEDVHNLCPLLFAPATDPASKLKPWLIT